MVSLVRGFNHIAYSNAKNIEEAFIPSAFAFNRLFREDFNDRHAEGMSCGSYDRDLQDIIQNDKTKLKRHKLIQIDRFNLHFVRQNDGIFESKTFLQMKENMNENVDLNEKFIKTVQKAVTYTLDIAEKWVMGRRCASFSLTFDWIIGTDTQSVKVCPKEYLVVPIMANLPFSNYPIYGIDSEADHFAEMTTICIPPTDGFILYSRVNFEDPR